MSEPVTTPDNAVEPLEPAPEPQTTTDRVENAMSAIRFAVIGLIGSLLCTLGGVLLLAIIMEAPQYEPPRSDANAIEVTALLIAAIVVIACGMFYLFPHAVAEFCKSRITLRFVMEDEYDDAEMEKEDSALAAGIAP